jgi:cytochrome c
MRVSIPGWGLLACVLFACADDGKEEKEMDQGQAVEAQATRGQTLFGRHCASCHGDSGQGDTAPRLVGLEEGALPLKPPDTRQVRMVDFVTVADVAGFAVANMPPGKGGSLSTDEYLAILAFDLKANGLTLEQELDLDLAAELTIPR